ncbi:MAG: hypothetical protein C0490_20770 [Marivirga sp.]|nr:hypothetical protein [Marivirga sp.]
MKSFKFFFNMILGTAFLSALIYGIAQRLVEQHATIFSFALMAVVIMAMAGMMRCLVSTGDQKAVTNK